MNLRCRDAVFQHSELPAQGELGKKTLSFKLPYRSIYIYTITESCLEGERYLGESQKLIAFVSKNVKLHIV